MDDDQQEEPIAERPMQEVEVIKRKYVAQPSAPERERVVL